MGKIDSQVSYPTILSPKSNLLTKHQSSNTTFGTKMFQIPRRFCQRIHTRSQWIRRPFSTHSTRGITSSAAFEKVAKVTAEISKLSVTYLGYTQWQNSRSR